MSDATYKTVNIVGSSAKSIDDAIAGAITKTSETIRNINWFEVEEIRGHVEDGKVVHFQVGMKLGFRIE